MTIRNYLGKLRLLSVYYHDLNPFDLLEENGRVPGHFTKIRKYGYLSNRNRRQSINEVLAKMKLPLHKQIVRIPIGVRMLVQFGIDLAECPCCKKKTLQLVKVFYPWKIGGDG